MTDQAVLQKINLLASCGAHKRSEHLNLTCQVWVSSRGLVSLRLMTLVARIEARAEVRCIRSSMAVGLPSDRRTARLNAAVPLEVFPLKGQIGGGV